MKRAVKANLIIYIPLIFILNALLPTTSSSAFNDKTALTEIVEEKGEFACLSSAEVELFGLINQFRRRNGLPDIPNSRSLNKVARMHAVDLNRNSPHKARDSRGISCNLHSWSKNEFWSPVCYTPDHKHSDKMLIKPTEITQQVYDSPAYENVYWSSVDTIFPRRVIQAWEDSLHHRELVLEQGIWAKSYWTALGVGVYKNVVTIWLGSMPDPQGPMKACPNNRNQLRNPSARQ